MSKVTEQEIIEWALLGNSLENIDLEDKVLELQPDDTTVDQLEQYIEKNFPHIAAESFADDYLIPRFTELTRKILDEVREASYETT